MERHHFDIDPLTGAVETFYFDHTNDTFTIDRVEDVQPLIDYTHERFKDAPGNWRGDMHHVASIPSTMLPELEKLGVMTAGGRIIDKQKLRAWLNDRDNRMFRTKPGRV